jgi:hypothetical protein
MQFVDERRVLKFLPSGYSGTTATFLSAGNFYVSGETVGELNIEFVFLSWILFGLSLLNPFLDSLKPLSSIQLSCSWIFTSPEARYLPAF